MYPYSSYVVVYDGSVLLISHYIQCSKECHMWCMGVLILFPFIFTDNHIDRLAQDSSSAPTGQSSSQT